MSEDINEASGCDEPKDKKQATSTNHPDLSPDAINAEHTIQSMVDENIKLLDLAAAASKPNTKKMLTNEAKKINIKLNELRNQTDTNKDEPVGPTDN